MYLTSSSVEPTSHSFYHTGADNQSHPVGLSQWARYPPQKQIGSGGFGNVYLCHDMLPESPCYLHAVAVKVVPLQTLSDSEIALAMNEVAILRHLCHPNILQYIDNFIDDERQLCLVSEYMDGGDLASLLRHGDDNDTASPLHSSAAHNSSLNPHEPAALISSVKNNTSSHDTKTSDKKHNPYWIESYRIADIIRQCLDGLAYLHSNSIIHRDIKPANIYITNQGVVKIGDFGVSKLVNPTDPTTATFIGTPFYLCPELCLGETYSFGADIWALGAVTYELYCAKLPFAADNVLAQIYVVTEGQYDASALYRQRQFSPSQLSTLELTYGDSFLQQEAALHRLVIALVERMLVPDPLARASSCQLLHEFFPSDVSPHNSPNPNHPSSVNGNGDCSSLHSSLVAVGRPMSRAQPTPNLAFPGTMTSTTTHTPRIAPRSAIPSPMPSPSAAVLASRVSLSYEAMMALLPAHRRESVRRASDFSASAAETKRRIPLPEDHMALERIPWLCHADAFFSLSLAEGVDDGVVRVDWTSAAHLPIASPHKRRLLSLEGRDDHACQEGSDPTQVRVSSRLFLSRPPSSRLSPHNASNHAAAWEAQRPLSEMGRNVAAMSSPNAATNATADGDDFGAERNALLGRCHGLSPAALESRLRQNILCSYAHRQRRLKATRDAQAAAERARAKQRAELDALYAQSFSATRLGEAMEKESPSPAAHAVTRGPVGSVWKRSATGAALPVAEAVMRMAREAAALAVRCEQLAALPPRRLDFTRTRRAEEAERASTSSDGDTQRGVNPDVYKVPVTLCIVRCEAHVVHRPPEALPASPGIAGKVCFPMSMVLKPMRRRTQLDGIIWRVKEALKKGGLDHALLFPLDIDDAEEVRAEELQLRYIDREGDVIAITEASDWVYVAQDWFWRTNLPWLQLYMVAL